MKKVLRVFLALLMFFAIGISPNALAAEPITNCKESIIKKTSSEKDLKIVGVIPARYASSRFPGKPLADICGKPMIWWVYQQAKKVPEFSEVYVATDDERIEQVCKKYGVDVIMTKNDHPNHIDRVHEVSDKIRADYYVCINGDEPLIEPESISKVIPFEKADKIYVGGAMRKLTDPAETVDPANIKVVVNKSNASVYMSRTAIPFPKGTLNFNYNKYVGIECFNKQALDFFVNTKMGNLEKIEDIDHLRFIENNVQISFSEVESDSLSVDTPKDLDKVREIMKQRLCEKKNA